MKKLMVIITALLFSAFFASSSFAALAACDTGGAYSEIEIGCFVGTPATGGKLEIKGSKSVELAYKSETTVGGLTYSLCTFHTQGSRQFASSSGDQKIFFVKWDDDINAAAPVACVDAPTGTAGADWSGASWSSL